MVIADKRKIYENLLFIIPQLLQSQDTLPIKSLPYVTNTILDDNYKGTTEQFVLHFDEQFRQLEEISDPSEHFPAQIKLQLLQNAVRPINDLRIVETLDEFESITTGYGKSSSLKYQTYYNLLINACVRYDRTKKANIARRGHIY